MHFSISRIGIIVSIACLRKWRNLVAGHPPAGISRINPHQRVAIRITVKSVTPSIPTNKYRQVRIIVVAADNSPQHVGHQSCRASRTTHKQPNTSTNLVRNIAASILSWLRKWRNLVAAHPVAGVRRIRPRRNVAILVFVPPTSPSVPAYE